MSLRTFVCSLLIAISVWADEEASNRIYVTASEWGQFYAKSIPSENYGLNGKTEIYHVGKEDKLIQTYPWYSSEIYLYGWNAGGVYVVRMGPWNRGHIPNKNDLALALYKDDKLLKKYSTLDIAGSEKNIQASKSHYVVLQKVIGFRRPFTNQLYFDVNTVDGRILSFDVETGKIVSPEEEKMAQQIDNAKNVIGNLKYEWFTKNKEKFEADKKIKLTQQMLEETSPENFLLFLHTMNTCPEKSGVLPNLKFLQNRS